MSIYLAVASFLLSVRGETYKDTYKVVPYPADCAQCADTSTADALMACFKSMTGENCVLTIQWTRDVLFDGQPGTKSCATDSSLGISLADGLVITPPFIMNQGFQVSLNPPITCDEEYPFKADLGKGPDASACGAVTDALPGGPYDSQYAVDSIVVKLVGTVLTSDAPYIGIKAAGACKLGSVTQASIKLITSVEKTGPFEVSGLPPTDGNPPTDGDGTPSPGDSQTSSPGDSQTSSPGDSQTSSTTPGGQSASSATSALAVISAPLIFLGLQL